MWSYILKRILLMIPTLLGVLTHFGLVSAPQVTGHVD